MAEETELVKLRGKLWDMSNAVVAFAVVQGVALSITIGSSLRFNDMVRRSPGREIYYTVVALVGIGNVVAIYLCYRSAKSLVDENEAGSTKLLQLFHHWFWIRAVLVAAICAGLAGIVKTLPEVDDSTDSSSAALGSTEAPL